jgi:hypothetical protein
MLGIFLADCTYFGAFHDLMTIPTQDMGMDTPADTPSTDTPDDPRYGAFLIRVWANDRDGRVRLVVQQVGSARQTAFADWNGIPRHVRECLARSESPPENDLRDHPLRASRGEGDRAEC